jgi:hypothetical protein
MKDKLKSVVDKLGLIDASSTLGLPIQKIIDILDLKFKTFDDIKFIEQLNGVRGRIMFDNGYGASVIRHNFSYGGKIGLYELAVLDKDGEPTYNTPITDDVMGYLTPEDVTEILIQIQDLKN